MNKKKAAEKAFEKNVLLSDDEVMEQGYYSSPSKTEHEAAADVSERIGIPINVKKKPENQKTRKPAKANLTAKPPNKPRSFDEPVEKISVEVPTRLVEELRILAVRRRTRFNIETAKALEMYIKRAVKGVSTG